MFEGTIQDRLWFSWIGMVWMAASIPAAAGSTENPGITTTAAPYVLVLGTAQDGGLPQIGCSGSNCAAAHRDGTKRRYVASLLLADAAVGKRWLIDATPDIREQTMLASGHPASRKAEGPRPPLFEGIFLTHAHTGHYTGLIHLGRPAYNANKTPVYASAGMCAFLSKNGPWEFMVKNENIKLHALTPDTPLKLSENISITPFLVPHRAEYTDTFGFIIRGPKRALLYIPDIDKWELWERPVAEVIASVDIALVDGTFYQGSEIPGRSMAEIPHPFIQESMERFQPLPDEERNKIHFTHLNHSNPAADTSSEAAARVTNSGMNVAQEGQRFEL